MINTVASTDVIRVRKSAAERCAWKTKSRSRKKVVMMRVKIELPTSVRTRVEKQESRVEGPDRKVVGEDRGGSYGTEFNNEDQWVEGPRKVKTE